MANFCFFDWETRSLLDLTVVGGQRYARHESTRPLVLSWALDDQRVGLWVPDLRSELEPAVWDAIARMVDAVGAFPPELHEHAKNKRGWIAWNAAFDRLIAQHCAEKYSGFPHIDLDCVLDAMAQAAAANLPGRLDMAGRALKLGGKTAGGKAVMKRFADASLPLPGAKGCDPADIEPDIKAWQTYLSYAAQDTNLMREVWRATRPLDSREWADYWASERINDRGMMVDTAVCEGAAGYRIEEAEHITAECIRITKGEVARPTLTLQINKWLYSRLDHSLADLMVTKRDEDGKPTNTSASKEVITRILDEIKDSDVPPDDDVLDFLELLQYGRASSSVKFQKMLDQAYDERLRGSYVFSGAGQTGRYSSRGVQIHNLPRATVYKELEVLDMIAAKVPISMLRAVPLTKDIAMSRSNSQPATPISQLLSRLIRPTFVAPPDKMLVWGDWSAIEARITPWLSKARDAKTNVLEVFERGEDIYLLNAAKIFNVELQTLIRDYAAGDPVAKARRQAGKVAVLALGFLGGAGALRAMARGYGIRMSNEEAKAIVDGWRAANGWARRFGDACLSAAMDAIRMPMNIYKAGRLTYVFLPGLMNGTLVCTLPDGRPIVYTEAKISKVEKFDRMVDAISYQSGGGRKTLWAGLLVENATQGTAASILRDTLRILDSRTDVVVGHTHDEVIAEVDTAKASGFAAELKTLMVTPPAWAEGLPLDAEITVDNYYHK